MKFFPNYFIDGIAWDWINEKLYWTDFCKDTIEVYDPASGYRRVLLYTGTSNNKDIVVDPNYWASCCNNMVAPAINLQCFIILLGGCIGLTMMEQYQKYSEFLWMEQLRQSYMTQAYQHHTVSHWTIMHKFSTGQIIL